MLVRSLPSISAHTLTSFLDADLLRKAAIFLLATAGSAKDADTRGWITIAGVALTCVLALANLGSRAWHFMGWRPLQYSGPGKSYLAFFMAVLVGILFPYMGHRKVHVGGKVAMEHVVTTAVLVGAIFAISDIDEVQRYLISSSENCDQDFVNIVVGGWFTFTFISSVAYTLSLPYKPPETPTEPDEEEPLLEKNHASPVGFNVPSLPNFEVDPTLASEGWFEVCALQMQAIVGVLLALVIGGGIIYLGFLEEDDEVFGNGEGIVRRLLSYVD